MKTIWQPSYTPPTVAREPRPVYKPANRKPHRRAYLDFHCSKTAQKVLDVIEQEDGITASDMIYKTRLAGVGQYIKTLLVDGYLICKPLPVPHANQRVFHYWVKS